MVDFREPEQIQAWLEEQPDEVLGTFAAKAALRALPGLATKDNETLDSLALPTFRATITALVSAYKPSEELGKQSASAASSALSAASSFAIGAPDSACLASAYAARSIPAEGHGVVANSASHAAVLAMGHSANLLSHDGEIHTPQYDAISATIHDDVFANALVLTVHERDRALLDEEHDIEDVLGNALWDTMGIGRGIDRSLSSLRQFWDADPKTWGFWQRWYDGMLRGEPLPWELQEQVALIPDEIWEAGPEAVAERIAEIEARLEVKRRNEALEEQLVRGVSQRLGIGGNNPPEAIDDLPPRVREETILIWEPILDLKEQTDAPVADPGKIRRAISKLIGMLAACGKWVGGKLDAAATEFAKEFGKKIATGIERVVTLAIVAHQLEVQALIRAAADWLSKLPMP